MEYSMYQSLENNVYKYARRKLVSSLILLLYIISLVHGNCNTDYKNIQKIKHHMLMEWYLEFKKKISIYTTILIIMRSSDLVCDAVAYGNVFTAKT